MKYISFSYFANIFKYIHKLDLLNYLMHYYDSFIVRVWKQNKK